jgi:hypothetical protein
VTGADEVITWREGQPTLRDEASVQREVACAERELGATSNDFEEREREVAVTSRGEPMSGREGEIA